MPFSKRRKRRGRDSRRAPGTPAAARYAERFGMEAIWYGGHPAGLALVPLGWLFRFGVALRRLSFRLQMRRVKRVEAPVIVVGNISTGGTGKTPLIIWLARYLARNFRPGVVCRGYGGRSRSWPQKVRGDSESGPRWETRRFCSRSVADVQWRQDRIEPPARRPSSNMRIAISS